MNITNKSRYGIKVLIFIAKNDFVQRRQIAETQSIGMEWLDQILIRLRACGVIVSKRGPAGGYMLTENWRSFNVWQIMSALEGWQVPVKCLDDHVVCSLTETCNARTPWETIYKAIRTSLEVISFESLLNQETPQGFLGLQAIQSSKQNTKNQATKRVENR